MGIKQFNGEWVAKEDRIIFRISTTEGEEFSFWFTRLMAGHFIQGSQQLAMKVLEQEHPPQIAQVVQEFHQQSLAQQVDFSQVYEPPPEKPLGAAPILVIGMQIDQGSDHHAVEFQLDNQKTVRLQMPPDVAQLMVTLLNKLQETARWHVGFGDGPTAALSHEAPTPAGLIH